MSRIGKLPIALPSNVSCTASGDVLKFKAGNVEKTYSFAKTNVVVANNAVTFSAKKEEENSSAFWGLHRSNVKNIVNGLKEAFAVTLEINGVGYKASVDKNVLSLTLGFSHDILYAIPKNITVKCEKPTILTISGSDKDLIGQVASEIMSFRKVEPYKGKGVYIRGQYIRRKEGKKK